MTAFVTGDLARARSRFLRTGRPALADPGRSVPRPIAGSWRRSAQAGVDAKGSATRQVTVTSTTLLARCAQIPMRQLVGQLGSLEVGVVLSDDESHVLARAVCGRTAATLLNGIDLAPGFDFSEGFVGTNGVGTVIETHRPIYVEGPAHFQERFLRYVCAGAPILHPDTKQLLGVLDLTCDIRDASPMMQTVALQAAHAIEQQLRVATARPGAVQPDRRPGGGRAYPVPLRQSVEEPAPDREPLRPSMGPTEVHRAPLPEAETRPEFVDGVSLSRGTRSSVWQLARQELRGSLRRDEATLLLGEIGVGKVALVNEVASLHRLHVHVLTADMIAQTGLPGLLGDLGDEDAPLTGDPVLVLRNVHLLPAHSLSELRRFLRAPRVHGAPSRVVLTAERLTEDEESPLSALLPFIARTIVVPPLRERRRDIPAIAQSLLDALEPGRHRALAPEVARILAAGYWPGNIHQLSDALRFAARHRPQGMISTGDLPPHAFSTALRPLTELQRQERISIITTLYRVHSNRSAAARALGISRATLYRRLREYGLD